MDPLGLGLLEDQHLFLSIAVLLYCRSIYGHVIYMIVMIVAPPVAIKNRCSSSGASGFTTWRVANVVENYENLGGSVVTVRDVTYTHSCL